MAGLPDAMLGVLEVFGRIFREGTQAFNRLGSGGKSDASDN
ncbi:MAG: hypothetical protein ABJK25_08275 [Halieaceae bacterium]